jgi:hypothetical protein
MAIAGAMPGIGKTLDTVLRQVLMPSGPTCNIQTIRQAILQHQCNRLVHALCVYTAEVPGADAIRAHLQHAAGSQAARQPGSQAAQQHRYYIHKHCYMHQAVCSRGDAHAGCENVVRRKVLSWAAVLNLWCHEWFNQANKSQFLLTEDKQPLISYRSSAADEAWSQLPHQLASRLHLTLPYMLHPTRSRNPIQEPTKAHREGSLLH